MDRDQNRNGSACHELRILDGDVTWRIVYAVEDEALVILDAFPKDSAALDGLTASLWCA
jgi:phage-related protein